MRKILISSFGPRRNPKTVTTSANAGATAASTSTAISATAEVRSVAAKTVNETKNKLKKVQKSKNLLLTVV